MSDTDRNPPTQAVETLNASAVDLRQGLFSSRGGYADDAAATCMPATASKTHPMTNDGSVADHVATT